MKILEDQGSEMGASDDMSLPESEEDVEQEQEPEAEPEVEPEAEAEEAPAPKKAKARRPGKAAAVQHTYLTLLDWAAVTPHQLNMIDLLKKQSLLDTAQAVDVQKGIFQRALHDVERYGGVGAWTDASFVKRYMDAGVHVLLNLDPAGELHARLLSGEVDACDLGMMTKEEMQPARWKKLSDTLEAKEKENYNMDAVVGIPKWCKRCKMVTKWSTYELQTRGGDEGMTTFMQCMICRT
jgi:hypothetical protein